MVLEVNLTLFLERSRSIFGLCERDEGVLGLLACEVAVWRRFLRGLDIGASCRCRVEVLCACYGVLRHSGLSSVLFGFGWFLWFGSEKWLFLGHLLLIRTW